MGNLGGGEILVILIVALLVLGPTRLPTVARQVGNAVGELRRLSSGFQDEMRSAMDEVSIDTADATTADDADPTEQTASDGEEERRARSRRLVTGRVDDPAAVADDEDLGARNGFQADEVETAEAAGDDTPT